MCVCVLACWQPCVALVSRLASHVKANPRTDAHADPVLIMLCARIHTHTHTHTHTHIHTHNVHTNWPQFLSNVDCLLEYPGLRHMLNRSSLNKSTTRRLSEARQSQVVSHIHRLYSVGVGRIARACVCVHVIACVCVCVCVCVASPCVVQGMVKRNGQKLGRRMIAGPTLPSSTSFP